MGPIRPGCTAVDQLARVVNAPVTTFLSIFWKGINFFKDGAGKVTSEDWEQRLELLQQLIYPAMAEGRHEQAKQDQLRLDARRKLTSFPVGSYVMARDPTPENKLNPRNEGPSGPNWTNPSPAIYSFATVTSRLQLSGNYGDRLSRSGRDTQAQGRKERSL